MAVDCWKSNVNKRKSVLTLLVEESESVLSGSYNGKRMSVGR